MVLNGKGGSGKSTIATNLAGYYASSGLRTALVDHDPQGAATRWLSLRPDTAPAIHGIVTRQRSSHVTRAWQTRVPAETLRVVVDTPAGVAGHELTQLIRQADAIIIPVLPSDADIYAATHFIEELLLGARLRATSARVGLVANRVRQHTRIYASLERFLRRLSFPLLAALRDTQNYIHAAGLGIGIHEMKPRSRVSPDLSQWAPLLTWLERPGNSEHARAGRSDAQEPADTPR